MQTKITEILSEAKGWMTAAEIATKGGWRSPANIGVSLQQMEKADGRVERQKSATKKQGNGMPATEWKLTEKTFGDHVADAGKKVEPVVKQSLSTAKPLAKPAHDDDVSRLRERIADLESYSGQLELTIDAWMNLAGEFECKSIPDLRVLIGSLESRVVTLQMSVGALREQLDSKPGDASFSVGSAAQFVVKTPSKPPRFTKKHSNAQATALSAARQHGFAEVFALVPVGKAVRGAEWRPK